jgi:3-oxoadipate enol-lactonase
MAAGEAQLTEAQLTDLLSGVVTVRGVVTGPGADQDGLTRPARTRPASRTTAVLPLPGAGLAYEATGDGPAVVLVHGFGLDMRMWEPQVEHLAARYRVVRYDCRGFGASGAFDPAVPYTHAGDLVALLDHLAIGEAVLAGLSFGGRVVLQTALAAPARVAGLVLLDAVLDGVPWDPESADALDELARRVQAGGAPAGREAWLAHPLFAAARQRPELAGQLAAMVAGYPGQHWLGVDPHRPVQRPAIEALEDVATPTLVAVGDRDVPGFREMSAVLARRIPGAEYRVVAGAGHMVNMEQPAAVNDLLTWFLAGLPAPATEGLSEQTEELTEQGDEQWSR